MENEKLKDNHPVRRRRGTLLLRFLLLVLRTLILLCSLYILGLFIWRYIRRSKSASTLAILILSAISSGWSFFSLFTTCLGHSKVAGFNILLDTVHIGVMVAIAVLLRSYAGISCGGTGTQRRNCKLIRAAFGIAVGLAGLYALTVIFSLLLIYALRRARPYGPSLENGYTNGYNPTTDRRGYIRPDLSSGRAYQRYRDSTYTTHSSIVGSGRDGAMNARESGDTAGLLAVPEVAAGHGYGRHMGARTAGAHTHEPYRAPTPVGGRQNARGVEIPQEREHGGTTQTVEYGRAF